ncbi:aminopeptidase N-like [Musca autumnalis]|uniref:aminopeptidase N-like n=1 Tax=Musca autumnalis TaxID=221902 RepID=UPI003CF9DF4D
MYRFNESICVSTNESSVFFADRVETITEYDFFVIHFASRLLKNRKYKLSLSFSGNLNKDSTGYFYNSYVDNETNKTHWISFTEFEPIYARSAFPCFDEPEYKAKFKIWLGHNKSLNALSNMPLKMQMPLNKFNGYVWSIFKKSLPISTYLVAFSINDFIFKEYKANDSDVVFRTWTRPQYIEQSSYALDIAPKLLRYYEKLFGIPFPLPKIDIIAIPQYGSGAMENWGLIIFKESKLLCTQDDFFEWSKTITATVMSHEFAHQWFGNLVSMKWWNDVWLKEGFATYLSSLGVDYILPGRGSSIENSIENAKNIFQYDDVLNSHPISNIVTTASEILHQFDSITYNKASFVIRMLHLFMGSEAFFEGIKTFLAKHKFNSAEADDLWTDLASAAQKYDLFKHGHNMKTFMDSWISQSETPLVIIMRNITTGKLSINQQISSQDSNITKCWWIPLTYTTAKELNFHNTTTKAWMECDETGKSVTLQLSNLTMDNEWVIFNVQAMGLYRVNYDVHNWQLIANFLKHDNFEAIPLINRIQLISDVFYFARLCHHGYSIALDLFEYLRRESEVLPWLIWFKTIFADLQLLAQWPEHRCAVMEYMRFFLQPLYFYVNELNVSTITSSKEIQINDLKYLTKEYACFIGLEECLHTAITYFTQWKSTINTDEEKSIPKDWKKTSLCVALQYGDENDWNFLWDYFNDNDQQDAIILTSLACTQNTTILRHFMDIAFSGGFKMPMFSQIAFESLASKPTGTFVALQYLIENISKIKTDFAASHLLYVVTTFAHHPDDLTKISDFVSTHHELFDGENIKHKLSIIDEINQKRHWTQRHLAEITSFIKNSKQLSTSKETMMANDDINKIHVN